MHNFSNLFDKVGQDDHASRQPTELAWQIPIACISVKILLMMDSGPVRNM